MATKKKKVGGGRPSLPRGKVRDFRVMVNFNEDEYSRLMTIIDAADVPASQWIRSQIVPLLAKSRKAS